MPSTLVPRAIESLRTMVPGLVADNVDIRDVRGIRSLLAAHDIDSVIHMAGLKAVGESVAQPLRYYENNVGGTLSLLAAAAASTRCAAMRGAGRR